MTPGKRIRTTGLPLAERVMARVAVDAAGCWNWQGSCRPEGYGSISVGGQTRRAHRVAYETFVGAIPIGAQLDHLCRNRACVRPDHLEPVSAKEKTLRGVGAPANNARKTHCLHGHPLSGSNLYSHRGRRACRACNVLAVKRYKGKSA